MRGEAVQIKGLAGKEFDQVFDEKGKAIGKKDESGNFIPYKVRGRPAFETSPRNILQKKIIASKAQNNS